MNEYLDECTHCGSKYDPDEQGHYDDHTGLMFCCQECECRYDIETGLPKGYERAGGVICLYCGEEMDEVDTTSSNIKTERAAIGQHTGNIWYCDDCDARFIEDLLAGGIVRPWAG